MMHGQKNIKLHKDMLCTLVGWAVRGIGIRS